MYMCLQCTYMYSIPERSVFDAMYCTSCSGAVDVFSVDDTTGVWSLSHTLQFTRRQFPGTAGPTMRNAPRLLYNAGFRTEEGRGGAGSFPPSDNPSSPQKRNCDA